MKAPLSWLKDFVPELPTGDAGAQKLADALTLGGLPVEHIDALPNGDRVLDVEVTSNRADCLSIQGVAREVAALLGLKFNPLAAKAPAAQAAEPGIAVNIQATDLCPHYTGRVIQGVTIAPSPAWLKDRLEAVGLRAINNLVDVTNYVLFELGQPLHAFDLAQLKGGQVHVRNAYNEEPLTTLDGKQHKLQPSMLVIADAEKPVALAGVMGGETSGVSFRTTDILLESARFDAMSIRKTARSLALASDSSYRFERGLDPTLAKRASDRACELILQTAGGKVVGPLLEAGAENFSPTTLTLRMSSLKRLLGVEWPVADAVEALKRLGFATTPRGEGVNAEIDVIVPSHRLDIRIETDLIEEVARIVGYEHIPTRDSVAVRLTQREPARLATTIIGQSLNANGYFEALTFSFVSDALAESFKHADAAKLHKVLSATRKADAQLRPSILPNLLECVARNENVGVANARLFETASTFWIDANGKSVERRALGIVGSTDYAELRGAVESLLKRLDARRHVHVSPTTRAGFGASACGEVRWGDVAIGYIGKTDRKIAEQLGLKDLPAIAELWLEPLVAGYVAVPQLQPLPSFPAVRRDLSLLLSDSVRYEQIESLVHELKLDALESMEFVTTYRGKPLEKGTKSLTFTLSFRKPDGTLTSGEVDERVAKVVELAKSKVGATLRA